MIGTIEPGIVLPLAAAAIAYAAGVTLLWRRAGVGAGVTIPRVMAFVAGLTMIALALLPPFDALADTLFSAHMAQHLVLMVAAPPLLLAGAPHVVLPWLMPDANRSVVLRAWHRSRAARLSSFLATPMPAVALYSAALWFWHMPGPYTAALELPAIHAIEHTAFFCTALLFWWAVLAPAARWRHRAYGQRIIAVFLVMLESGALGALLMFARRVWYPVHAAGAARWGLTALADQQLAGLIMWIPAGLVHVGTVLVLAAHWFGREEAVARRLDRAIAPVRVPAHAEVIS